MRDRTVQREIMDKFTSVMTPPDDPFRCAVCMAEIVGCAWARWQHAYEHAGRIVVKVTCGSWYCRARVVSRNGES